MNYGMVTYKSDQICKVFVNIIYPNGSYLVRLWQGKNLNTINAAAKAFYDKKLKLEFGKTFYMNY